MAQSDFDLEQLRQARMGMSERWWNALFQQRPTSAEGAEIKRAWWRWYDALPVRPDQMDLRVLSQIEAGNVWLPHTRWAEHMVEEHASFPLGRNDDTVDMLSQLLNYLADMRSTPISHLQGGDDSFVSPDILAERDDTAWRSVFDRVRRAV